MQTELNISMATIMADIRAIHADTSFISALAKSMQQTVQAIQDAATSMRQLISDEAQNIRDHQTSEARQLSILATREAADGRQFLTITLESQEAERLHQEKQIRLRQALLQRLAFPAMSTRSEAIYDTYGTTFRWIFKKALLGDLSDDAPDDSSGDWSEDEYGGVAHRIARAECDFGEWLSTDAKDRIYWISGKAGSGKSSLMNLIATDVRSRALLETWAAPKRYLVVSHYFWAAGATEQRGFMGFLRSIIYQLLTIDEDTSHQLFTSLQQDKDLLSQNLSFDSSWVMSRKNLEIILRRICTQLNPTHRICVLIDGLDEFSDEQYKTQDLLLLIDDLLTHCSGSKVCVASRPEAAFQQRYASKQHLKLEDLTRDDMIYYVEERLSLYEQARSLKQHDKQRFSDFVQSIVYKAEGVFLWTALVMRVLEDGIPADDDLEGLERRLEELPVGLTPIYKTMLNRFDRSYHKEAGLLLNFMLRDDLRLEEVCLMDIVVLRFLFSRGIVECLDKDAATEMCNDLVDPGATTIQALRKWISTRCLGMLEVTVKHEHMSRKDIPWGRVSELNIEDRQAILKSFAGPMVHFIHRSAADFLGEDEEARKFLSLNSLPTHRVMQLYVDYLMTINTTLYHADNDTVPSHFGDDKGLRYQWRNLLLHHVTDEKQRESLLDRIYCTSAAFEPWKYRWTIASLNIWSLHDEWPLFSVLEFACYYGSWQSFHKRLEAESRKLSITYMLFLIILGFYHRKRSLAYSWDDGEALDMIDVLTKRGALNSGDAFPNRQFTSKDHVLDTWKSILANIDLHALVYRSVHTSARFIKCIAAFLDAGADKEVSFNEWSTFDVNAQFSVAVCSRQSARTSLQGSAIEPLLHRKEFPCFSRLNAVKLIFRRYGLMLYLRFEAVDKDIQADLYRSLLSGGLQATPEILTNLWNSASARSLIFAEQDSVLYSLADYHGWKNCLYSRNAKPPLGAGHNSVKEFRKIEITDTTLSMTGSRKTQSEQDVKFDQPSLATLCRLMAYEDEVRLVDRCARISTTGDHSLADNDELLDPKRVNPLLCISYYNANSQFTEQGAQSTPAIPALSDTTLDVFKKRTNGISESAIPVLKKQFPDQDLDTLLRTSKGRRDIVVAIRRVCTLALNAYFMKDIEHEFIAGGLEADQVEGDRYTDHWKTKRALPPQYVKDWHAEARILYYPTDKRAKLGDIQYFQTMSKCERF